MGVKLTRDELEAIVEQTSFDSMKKVAEKAPSVVKMFRKGKNFILKKIIELFISSYK